MPLRSCATRLKYASHIIQSNFNVLFGTDRNLLLINFVNASDIRMHGSIFHVKYYNKSTMQIYSIKYMLLDTVLNYYCHFRMSYVLYPVHYAIGLRVNIILNFRYWIWRYTATVYICTPLLFNLFIIRYTEINFD